MTEPFVAVIDYGIGNLGSAEKALARVGSAVRLTADPDVIATAQGVVLPGVGSFGPSRKALERTGLDVAALAAIDSGRPFLGICVGMQLLYEASEENPGIAGLGVFEGTIKRLPPGVKHPQMQWNRLQRTAPCRLLDGLGESPWMYFVHSFAAEVSPAVVATFDYGGVRAAAVRRGNVMATQFHPEKSGPLGLELLSNFVKLCDEHRNNTSDKHLETRE